MTMQGKIRADEVQEGDKILNRRGQTLFTVSDVVAQPPNYLIHIIGRTANNERRELVQRGDVLVDVQRD